MTTIGLAYGTPVTIENCEDAWNESTSAGTTATADDSTGNYVVGSKSSKLALASDCGVEILATEAINLSASTANYIAWWFKSSVALNAGDMQLLLDEHANCVSPSETLNFPAAVANQWTRAVVACSGADTTRDVLISVGVKQAVDKGALNLWVDDIVGYPYYKSLSVYAVRGLDDPDDIEYWPTYNIEHLDGSLKEYFNAFRRIVSIDIGPLTTKSDRIWIHNYLMSTTKRVIGTYDDIAVTLAETRGFSNAWLNDVESFRSFILRLKEKDVRTANPNSWSYS